MSEHKEAKETKEATEAKNVLKNRHEFLFGYDCSMANPNGDPMDENKPRIDEETGINLVRDARLKRTVRDTLQEDFGQHILIRKELDENGKLKLKPELIGEVQNEEQLLNTFIDVRLFGLTFASEGKRQDSDDDEGGEETEKRETKKKDKKISNNLSYTGPVQFQYGKSLHRVEVITFKGTSVIPSKKGNEQGTMTETHVVAYSFIAFYGIANEKNAQKTKLTDEDIDLMLEAMWIGHKAGSDVLTGSKIGHNPRILIDVMYKEGTKTQIGELDSYIKLKTDKEEEAIRSVDDFTLDITPLIEVFKKNAHKIEKIRVAKDERLKLSYKDEEVNRDLATFIKEHTGIDTEEFEWFKEL